MKVIGAGEETRSQASVGEERGNEERLETFLLYVIKNAVMNVFI